MTQKIINPSLIHIATPQDNVPRIVNCTLYAEIIALVLDFLTRCLIQNITVCILFTSLGKVEISRQIQSRHFGSHFPLIYMYIYVYVHTYIYILYIHLH